MGRGLWWGKTVNKNGARVLIFKNKCVILPQAEEELSERLNLLRPFSPISLI